MKLNDVAFKTAGIKQPDADELLRLTKGDSKTWSMYANGYTMGLNQTEREKTTARVKQYKPTNIVELSAFVAAIRPSFQSMLNTFLSRNKFSFGIPVLDSLLQTPEMGSSFLVYQEQIFTVLMKAGISAPDAYTVIKAISKKKQDVIHSFRERFMEGFVPYIMTDGRTNEKGAKDAAEATWKIIEDSAAYSFNACVSGDTVVVEAGTVKDLYGFGPKLALSMNEHGHIIYNPTVDVREAGVRPLYRMTLDNGMYIDCTANHKFPVGQIQKRLDEIHIGDPIWVRSGDDTHQVAVAEIRYLRDDMTYDVEMADPYHNFVANDGIVTCNSHAYCVALDSLYSAYAKAHYPYEFYVSALRVYGEKQDKKRLAKIKNEMLQAFNIKVAVPRFGQDNRDFFVDKEHGYISDALSSTKHIAKRSAEVLYELGKNHYDYFVELLRDIVLDGTVNTRQQEILIRLSYFSDFGPEGKLLTVWDEFHNGKARFSKSHVEKTQQQRMSVLRDIETMTEGEPMSPAEKLKFETEYLGSPVSTFPQNKGQFTVIDIDTKYSPKVDLYNVSTGTTGRMKMRKYLYEEEPIEKGDTIVLEHWDRRPAYQFTNGKAEKKRDEYELWIEAFSKVS